MEAWDNLAHQIALLSLNPKSGSVRRRWDLALATAAGALAELAIQERVSLVGRRVRVNDARPTEDPLLDTMLGLLTEKGDRYPTRILDSARRTYLNQALAELVSNGWVRLVPGEGLRGDRYQVVDTQRLDSIRELAAQGLRDPHGAPTRAACLGGLAYEMGLGAELVPELGWWPRLKAQMALRRRDWVVRAVYQVKAARHSAAAGAGA